MGAGVFARLQHTPGIRQWDPRAELGPDLCLNMGPGSETGSRSPGGSYLEMEGVCLGRRVLINAQIAVPCGVMFPDNATLRP